MDVTRSGMVKNTRREQNSKAPFLIDVTLFGMVIELRL